MNWKNKIIFGILAILLIGSVFVNLKSLYYSECSKISTEKLASIESKIKKEYLNKFLINVRESEAKLNNLKLNNIEQNKGEMSVLLAKQEELDKITSRLIDSLENEIKENEEIVKLREMNMYRSKENGGLFCAEGYEWEIDANKCILVENEELEKIEEKLEEAYSEEIDEDVVIVAEEDTKCADNLILTQNLRAPWKKGMYIRNGEYDKFTKGIVKEVKILQRHLNRLGFSSGKVDGVIGWGTRSAILALQKHFGVKQDGLIGAGTRELINNSCN